ncbi:MAG: hypothetical protein QW803_13345 [Candidatus Methanomethylicia archaeon]
MELKIEFKKVDDLIPKLHEELKRYGILTKFIEYSISLMKQDDVKTVKKMLERREEELETIKKLEDLQIF